MIMLALLASAAAAQPAAGRPAGPVVQASATIRIVAGARLTLGSQAPDAQLRTTRLRDADGRAQPARLIEFQ